MENTKQSRIILYLSFTILLFYPLKGLISVAFCLLAEADISTYIVPLIYLGVALIACFNLLVNRIVVPTKIDKILFFAGCFAMLMGVIRRDNVMLQYTLFLFLLHPAFYKFININNNYFRKCVFAFLLITTLYLSMEHIVLYPSRFGLNFDPPTNEAYQNYTKLLVSGNVVLEVDNIKKFSERGIPLRTGGYLASVLVMPVLLAMSTTFFYVLMRERFFWRYVFLTILNIFLLINSVSTTAMMAFLLTFLFYEFYVARKIKALVFACIPGALIFYVMTTTVFGAAIVNRVLTNLSTPEYTGKFFNASFFNSPEALLSLFIGTWGYFRTHVDFIGIAVSYGVIFAYLLFKRILFPLWFLNRTNNLEIRLYSLMVLTAFICFFHATMTLNVNIMILVTLLFLKAGDLYRKEQLDKNNLVLAPKGT